MTTTASLDRVLDAIVTAIRSGPLPHPDALARLLRIADRINTRSAGAGTARLQVVLQARGRSGAVTVPGVQGRYAPDAAGALLTALGSRPGDDEPALSALCVASAVFGLGLADDRDCGTAASAFTVGRRVAAALRDRLDAPLRHRGWDPLGVVGRIGASAAAAAMLRLDAGQASHAVGLAASGAGGMLAAPADRWLLAARCTADAVQAALLARHGFTAAVAPLLGRRGLLAVMLPGADPRLLDPVASALTTCPEPTERSADPRLRDPIRTLFP